jgi:hypothetical protein
MADYSSIGHDRKIPPAMTGFFTLVRTDDVAVESPTLVKDSVLLD